MLLPFGLLFFDWQWFVAAFLIVTGFARCSGGLWCEPAGLTGPGTLTILGQDMDEIAVLVLNYTYEPLHFTNARRAVTLLLARQGRERRVLAPRGALALAGVPAARR